MRHIAPPSAAKEEIRPGTFMSAENMLQLPEESIGTMLEISMTADGFQTKNTYREIADDEKWIVRLD